MNKIVDRRTKSFFLTENRLVDDGHIAIMGGNAFAVYSCLCRHANTDHQCFPSFTKLESETGYSRPTISKLIGNLIEMGYIRKLSLGSSRGKANVYEIMDLPDPNQLKNLTSKKNKLVKKINQTSKKIKPPLVKKFNSKNTNRKITNEDYQGGGGSHPENPYQGSRAREVPPFEKSAFSSVQEGDDFYRWHLAELLKEEKMTTGKAKAIANRTYERLRAGESTPADRLSIEQFRGGLQSLTRTEQNLLKMKEFFDEINQAN